MANNMRKKEFLLNALLGSLTWIPQPITADDNTTAANMRSDPTTFTNPGCRITEAGGAATLPVLEPNVTPNAADSYNISIETIKGYLPYITLTSPVTISGMENTGFPVEVDDVTLKEYTYSGVERAVDANQQLLESSDVEQTDFATQLFFRLKKTKDKYPATLIEVDATVTFACVQAN